MNIHEQLAAVEQDRRAKLTLKQRLQEQTDRAFDALMRKVDEGDPQCLKLYMSC